MLMVDSAPRLLIREWRTFRRLTQQALADCMGTDKSVVSDLETGRRRWNADHISRASRCLDCEPYQLITTDPNLETPIADVWEKIPPERRDEARSILEVFMRKGKTPPAKGE